MAGCRKNTPGCAVCCGAVILCPGCGGGYQPTYYANIPALGITSLPLPFASTSGSATIWGTCTTASVLGYAICIGGPPPPLVCVASTITAAFLISFHCFLDIHGVPTFTLQVDWFTVLNYATGGVGTTCSPPIASADYRRAVDIACSGGTFGTCPNALSSFNGRGLWTQASGCAVPATVTFTGAPDTAGATNYYLGTAATVKDTP
jgi:hypothetical protein